MDWTQELKKIIDKYKIGQAPVTQQQQIAAGAGKISNQSQPPQHYRQLSSGSNMTSSLANNLSTQQLFVEVSVEEEEIKQANTNQQ